MTEQTIRSAGSIHDLGYHAYEGERLGRGYALLALFTYSFRAVFGIGRSVVSKVFPFGLATVAFIPALVQLGIAAIAPADLELITPQSYFGFVAVVLALFCAFTAPEIIGRDQRTHTLSLYFARSLSRSDYVVAKVVSLAAALILVLIVPQILLLLGGAVAGDDTIGYLQDNAGDLAPILAGAAMVGLLMGGISLTIAGQTARRALATGAVLAYFVIFTAIGSILVDTLTGDARQYALLVSPLGLLEGAVYWLFSATPRPGSELANAGLAGGYYFLAACIYIVVPLALLFRRLQRLAV